MSRIAFILDCLSDILPGTQVNTGLRKHLVPVTTVENFFEGTGLRLRKSGIVSLFFLGSSFRFVS